MEKTNGPARHWTREHWQVLFGVTAMSIGILVVGPVLLIYRGIKGLFVRGSTNNSTRR